MQGSGQAERQRELRIVHGQITLARIRSWVLRAPAQAALGIDHQRWKCGGPPSGQRPPTSASSCTVRGERITSRAMAVRKVCRPARSGDAGRHRWPMPPSSHCFGQLALIPPHQVGHGGGQGTVGTSIATAHHIARTWVSNATQCARQRWLRAKSSGPETPCIQQGHGPARRHRHLHRWCWRWGQVNAAGEASLATLVSSTQSAWRASVLSARAVMAISGTSRA